MSSFSRTKTSVQRRRTQPEQGYALVAVLVLVVVMAGMISAAEHASVSSLRAAGTDYRRAQAFYAAQAGLERAEALANASKNDVSARTDLGAAQALAQVINNKSQSFGVGGRYVLEAAALSASDGAILRLRSRGYAPGDVATRRLEIAMRVKAQVDLPTTPLLANAPAALSVTGNSSINGSAPIAGETGNTSLLHTMQCPPSLNLGGSCRMKTSLPPRYTLTYKGAIPAAFEKGAHLRPTTVGYGETSEERYVVEEVNRVTGEVTMLAVSDLIKTSTGSLRSRTFPGTGDIVTKELANTPAVLAPPGMNFGSQSANVRQVCTVYECSHYSLSSDALFMSVLGGSKDEIEDSFKAVPGIYNQTGVSNCGTRVEWMKLRSSNLSLKQCSSSQLSIVDMRGQNSLNMTIIDDATGSTNKTTFRGLLYILADPGVSVKFAANSGFAGALVVDNGNGGLDLRGTGNFNMDCDLDVDEDLKKTAKLCYSDRLLSPLRSAYENSGVFTAKARVKLNAQTWKEISDAAQ